MAKKEIKEFDEQELNNPPFEPDQVDGEKVSLGAAYKKLRSVKVDAESILDNMPFILFIAFLMVLYIGNTHLMETTMRDIDHAKNDLKEYRWKYMSSKSSLMFNSKQTEIATAVEGLGLKELTAPPQKIEVTEGEY